MGSGWGRVCGGRTAGATQLFRYGEGRKRKPLRRGFGCYTQAVRSDSEDIMRRRETNWGRGSTSSEASPSRVTVLLCIGSAVFSLAGAQCDDISSSGDDGDDGFTSCLAFRTYC